MAEHRQGLSLQQRRATGANSKPRADERRLEYSSRGDRVPARLIEPRTEGPHPVVVLVHAAGASKYDPQLDVGPLVAADHAVLAVDLPLHGERHSPKLSELLLAALRDGADGTNASTLLDQFAWQSQHDVQQALDAVAALPELDTRRVGLAGIGVGALIAACVGRDDPRPRAIALSSPPIKNVPRALVANPTADGPSTRPVLEVAQGRDAGKAIADFFTASL